MVHTIAASGVVAAVAAASLLTSSSVTQKFATAQVQDYSDVNVSHVTCQVADIGVFQSTYTPECNHLPGTEFTSDTTTFWPMFPAVNSYGANSPDGLPKDFSLLGLSGAPFTTCPAYMTESFNNVSSVGKQIADIFYSDDMIDYLTNGCVTHLPNSMIQPLGFPGDGTDCGPATNCTSEMSYAQCLPIILASGDDASSKLTSNLESVPGLVGDDDIASLLLDLVENKCIGSGATTASACFGGYWFWASLFPGFKVGNPNATVTEFLPRLINRCLDNLEDQSAIEYAQNMVVAGLVFAWIAVILGLVTSVYYVHKYIHVAPASSILLAGILGIAGLARVNSAPIHKTLGAPCAATNLCYSTSTSSTLAIVGVAIAFVAFVVFAAANFFEGPKLRSSEETVKNTEEPIMEMA